MMVCSMRCFASCVCDAAFESLFYCILLVIQRLNVRVSCQKTPDRNFHRSSIITFLTIITFPNLSI